MENCPNCKKDPREKEFIETLQSRLNRVTGQLNGISKMIADNRYCHDILIQLAAAEAALKEVGYMILKDHLLTCVTDDIKEGNTKSLIDALEISKKLN